MDEHETMTDEFRGIRVRWALGSIRPLHQSTSNHQEQERRYYRLTFHKRYREIITVDYLEHVMEKGRAVRVSNRQRKLYTNSSNDRWSWKANMWSHVPFDHPATFKTIAMEPEKKNEIIEDLLTFSQSKDFYAEIGKPWKRGYLLHGPPGTGKSTMIAAMANLLGYDVYDLELTSVKDNTELRKLLIETTSKSIIVIEDIDCSLDLTGQRKKKEKQSEEGEDEEEKKETPQRDPWDENRSKVTLSGLLNFIDGLWSACGGERLIVFTTNYVEKLDPALIRRGRMDMHIELSYCSFEAFKVLARNYLKLEAHPMFESIKKLMEEAKITPADVAENLMPKSRGGNAEKCLSNLIQALEKAKEEAAAKKANKEAAAKKANEEAAAKKANEEAAAKKANEEAAAKKSLELEDNEPEKEDAKLLKKEET